MKSIRLLILTCLFLSFCKSSSFKLDAYYTRLSDPHPALTVYQDSLFGRYSDLVVEIGRLGDVVFSRQTSYLPVWQTEYGEWTFPELIERKGDGDEKRPDIISKYSHVRLIEKSPERIVVHWRYFPDFEALEWDDVVDEYFTVKADGKIEREIRPGTGTVDAWQEGYGRIHQTLGVTREGLLELSFNENSGSGQGQKEKGKPASSGQRLEAEIWLTFDENLNSLENTALEAISGNRYQVEGHSVLQKKSIAGKALHFDGYYSGISIPDFQINQSDPGFTLQAWVALGAYPFGWAPLVHQSEWGKDGFYLGIDQYGFPGVHLGGEDGWISVVDSTRLKLYNWYHLAATYDHNSERVTLYLNGERKGRHQASEGRFQDSETPLMIGLNRQKMPPVDGRIRRGKWPSLYGIDGLVDEVRIQNRALSDQEMLDQFKAVAKDNVPAEPDMEPRALPVHPENKPSDRFTARYTKLDYYETWDNLWRVSEHPDIVVSFDRLPVNVVFWRGTSYGPYFVTENGRWIGDQSNEDYRLLEYKGEAEGCLEHMSDKQCRHSHVRIVEDTEARKLIHWRYGLVDSRYYFAPWNGGWGGWTDEYWTIYPDGVAIRDVRRGIVFGDGWVETMFLSAPGTRPEDNVEFQAYSVLDTDGKRYDFSWEEDSPEGIVDDVAVTIVNSKSDYHMFNIYPPESSIEIFGGHSRYSHFHWWNHWPVSQITSDGRGARASDRLAHSSLAWGAPGADVLMYGMTNENPESLMRLAKSWRFPPKVEPLSGIQTIKYIQEERAWHIMKKGADISFRMEASEDQPVVNPVFVIKNDKQPFNGISINDKPIPEDKIRMGFIRVAEGENRILWVEQVMEKQVKISIN